MCAVGAGSRWAGSEGERVVLHPNGWVSGDVRGLEGRYGVGAAGEDGMFLFSGCCGWAGCRARADV